MTILVTGAAGFIGSHLARYLAAHGRPVRALDVRPPSGALRHPLIQYHRVDLCQAGAVGEVLEGVDTVYHLASAHLEVNTSAGHFEDVNVGAAANLAAECAAKGVRRLVHTSSVGVYGHVANPPASESAPCAPRNVYERTKLAGEEAVLAVAAATSLDVIVLRPAWVYGPGCVRTAKLIRSLRRKRFVYIGEGSNLRHPLFIDDLLHAFELAACAPPKISGRVYNIAGPRALTLRELVETYAAMLGVAAPRGRIPRVAGVALARGAELIWRVTGAEPPFSRRSLLFFESDNAFDTSAALRDLRFRAETDLKQGLRRTLEAEAWERAA